METIQPTDGNAERIRRLRENNEEYRETERRANALATAERMGKITLFILTRAMNINIIDQDQNTFIMESG